MWPDLAIFSSLANCTVIWKFFEMINLVFGDFLNLFWQIYYATAKIFSVFVSKYWTRNVRIWSYCWLQRQQQQSFPAKSKETKKQKQCDQIGRFLKVIGDKISIKSSPNYFSLLGLFWKTSLLCKNCYGYFLGNFRKHLGYFLLWYLVTLVASKQVSM